MSLEDQLLEDENPREDGSTAGIKLEEISGEGEQSGEGNPTTNKREIVAKPPTVKKTVKPKAVAHNKKTKVTTSNLKSKAHSAVQKSPPQVVKKILPAKSPPTDKRFAKLIGSTVACRISGKKALTTGNLRWVGHLPKMPTDDPHLIAGVELTADNKLGTDGTYRGVRYFSSAPKRGYFFRLKDCKAVKH